MSERNKDNLSRKDWLSHDPAIPESGPPAGKGTPEEWEDRARRGRALLPSEEDASDLLAELDAAIDEQYGDNPIRELPGKSANPLRRRLAIAAAVLLAILAAWWLIPGAVNTERLFAAHFTHLDNSLSVTLMSDAGQPEDALARSLRPYNTRDYAAAVQSLRAYLDQHPDSTAVRLYYGISLLADHQPDQAIEQLDQVQRADLHRDFRESADWYTALAELRADHKAAAIDILKTITKQSHAYRAEAETLLSALQ